jgi:hypothetical protein
VETNNHSSLTLKDSIALKENEMKSITDSQCVVFSVVSAMVILASPGLAATDYSHKVTVTGVKPGAWNVRIEIDPASGYNSHPTALQNAHPTPTTANKPPVRKSTPSANANKPTTTPSSNPPVNTAARRTNPKVQQAVQKMGQSYTSQMKKSISQPISQAVSKLAAQQAKTQPGNQQMKGNHPTTTKFPGQIGNPQAQPSNPGTQPMTNQPTPPANQPMATNQSAQIPPDQLAGLRNSIMRSVRARNRELTRQIAQMLQNQYNTSPDSSQNVTDAMNQFLDALGQMQAQQAFNQALAQQQQQPPPDEPTAQQQQDAADQAQQNLDQTMQDQLPDQAQNEIGTDMDNQMQQLAQNPLPVDGLTDPSGTDSTNAGLKPTDYARIADEAGQLAQGDLSKEHHYLEVALRCLQDVTHDPSSTQTSIQQAKQYAGTTLVDKFTNLQQRCGDGSSASQTLRNAIEQDIRTCQQLGNG